MAGEKTAAAEKAAAPEKTGGSSHHRMDKTTNEGEDQRKNTSVVKLEKENR